MSEDTKKDRHLKQEIEVLVLLRVIETHLSTTTQEVLVANKDASARLERLQRAVDILVAKGSEVQSYTKIVREMSDARALADKEHLASIQQLVKVMQSNRDSDKANENEDRTARTARRELAMKAVWDKGGSAFMAGFVVIILAALAGWFGVKDTVQGIIQGPDNTNIEIEKGP